MWQSLPSSERETQRLSPGGVSVSATPTGTSTPSSPGDTIPADIGLVGTADTEMDDTPDFHEDEEQLAAMQAILADAGDNEGGEKLAGLRSVAAKLERKVSAARERSVLNRTLKLKSGSQTTKGAGCS